MKLTTEAKINTDLSCFEDVIDLFNATKITPISERFDKDWNTVHSWTDSEEGLADFRGAKYVQSRIGDTFHEAESFLKQGRQVLFSGTPCQIAGLKNFLRKEYDGLLTVDIVCHGVPSPLVWQHYLASLHPDEERITSISMRDKKEGWKRYRMEIWTGNKLLYAGKAMDNLYSKGYLADLFIRPSCHACPARKGKSGSDITIGDFWGIDTYYPAFDDDKGTGLVIVNYFATKKLDRVITEMLF